MSKTLEEVCKIINSPLFATEYNHILEFGVWKGNSILKIRNNVSEKYKVFGFDSFIGLPEDWPETQYKKGAFSIESIEDKKTVENLKNEKNIKIYEGWFKDTIPEYLKEADDIALLHVDCDIYSSTIDIFFSDIGKYVKTGTLIVFDDWEYLSRKRTDVENEGQHNQKAFKEWAKKFNVNYLMLASIEPFRQAILIL